MKRLIIISIITPFVAVVARANAWNVADEFSANGNPNGAWSYGYYHLPAALGIDLPIDSPAYTNLTSSSAGSNYKSWSMPPETSVLNITAISGQENVTLTAGFAPLTAFYAPVIRWVAPSNGYYLIVADFSYSGIGAATFGTSQAGLRSNETTLSYAYIGSPGDHLHVERTIDMSVGQYLDFFVAKGQHSINLTSVISSVPEPSTYLLFVFGIAAIRSRLLTIRSTGPIVVRG